MKRITTLIVAGILAIVLLVAGYETIRWTVMRVTVDKGECLVVINKFGNPLPPDRVVVPKDNNSYQGIEEEVLGPGRYFFDPLRYDTKKVPLIDIPAGNPEKWGWDTAGNLKDKDDAPMVGLVSLREGQNDPNGGEVVTAGYKGIQRQVLTPGTYKINPYRYDVTIVPAVVIPPGSVGVVTQLVPDDTLISSVPLTQAATPVAASPSSQPSGSPDSQRLVAGPQERGILKDVLQPGIYYLNPKMVHVTIFPIGYDQVSLDHSTSTSIKFTTSDAYQIEADLTVVWGRTPSDAPNIVANIGNVEQVTGYVIEPAAKAACQNEGGKYTAKDLIQGITRSQFQDDLSESLDRQVQGRHIHILLALIRNITIKDSGGNDQTMGLLATIQQANIEVERDLTNKQKTQTAIIDAQLQQSLKAVDIARATVSSETDVKVANIVADGQKKAAEIDAQRELTVASIELQIATLDAQRTQILGKADADVSRLKNDAQAKGAKMLVDAFGSPQAYNLYTFAKNFNPDEMRMIFAGPGTLWTDLKSFQQIGAARAMDDTQPAKK